MERYWYNVRIPYFIRNKNMGEGRKTLLPGHGKELSRRDKIAANN